MRRPESGFTLIELMIVVVIIGILAAIAIPNYIAMQNRAKEGSTKSNMHTFQLTAEDYGVQNNGLYGASAGAVVTLMPNVRFTNPFNRGTGAGVAWEDRATTLTLPSPTPGITSYADTLQAGYNIKGYGTGTPLALELSSGT